LHQLRFAAQIKKLISRYGLDPSWLSLELTESTLVDDINSAVKIMQALRDVGIGIAIDDFGTGFSSLSYLQRLPIDTLKIDRSFVRRIPENRDDMKLIRSIISIGKELDLIVVAEGVETEQQLQFLQAVQCDQIQGYIYSKPLPAADFLEYVRNHPSRRVPGR
jgi:EAL domain-containing protein (putative c-di-GMP-specific phosphodiesterase class I)